MRVLVDPVLRNVVEPDDRGHRNHGRERSRVRETRPTDPVKVVARHLAPHRVSFRRRISPRSDATRYWKGGEKCAVASVMAGAASAWQPVGSTDPPHSAEEEAERSSARGGDEPPSQKASPSCICPASFPGIFVSAITKGRM